MVSVDEGVKDRPCAVILVTIGEIEEHIVTVWPVTHSPPADLRLAMELPTATKARLQLDEERSWVVLPEAKRLIWPGPDLRPGEQAPGRVAHGLLPYGLTVDIHASSSN